MDENQHDGAAALMLVTALIDLLNRSPGGEGIADRIDQYMIELASRPAVEPAYRAALTTARNVIRGIRE
jgi:hypothetical protein